MQAVTGLVATTVIVGSLMGASVAAEEDVRLKFRVPAMPADRAVKRFAIQSKRSVLFRADDIRNVWTNPVRGEFTVKEGLKMLFEGTSLSGNLTRRGAIIVSEKKVEEAEGAMFEKSKKIVPMTSAVAIMLGANGYAQEANEPVEVVESEVTESVVSDEENLIYLDDVKVTGSRLGSAYLNSPAPITTIGIDELRNSGRVNLSDALKRIPALNQTDPSPTNTGGRNRQFLNLRGFGGNRTLTLVNGNRYVPGAAGSSSVDINSIPVALIERVDIATGGMSAVYGADAISGVVNFVLKEDYEGFNVRAQHGGNLEHWDGEGTQISLLAGKNFADGRGNVTASYSFTQSKEVPTANRDYLNEDFFALVGNPAGSGPAVYGRDPLSFSGANYSPLGAVFPFAFDENFNQVTIHGDGSVYDDTTGPTQSELFPTNIIEPTEGQNVSFNASYDISDGFRPYVNVMYSQTESTTQRFDPNLGGFLFDATGHPFISPLAQSQLFGFDSWSRSERGADLPRSKYETQSFQAFAGAKGDVTDWLRYEVSAGYGRTNNTVAQTALDTVRFAAATDVISDGAGGALCAPGFDFDTFESTPPPEGCVPFNVFVRDPAVNGAARDWVFRRGTYEEENDQLLLNGFVSGSMPSLPFSLQGGDIEFVLGVEYREESYDVEVDEAARNGDTGAPFALTTSPELSSSDVFGELSFPIFFDYAPGMHELTLQLAARISDQNVTGENETYNAGLTWAPTQDVKFRTSFSRAVRAPGLFELFSPGFESQGVLTSDPCDDIRRLGAGNGGQGTEFRAANCQLLLENVGLSPADAANYNLERDTDFFGDYTPGDFDINAGFHTFPDIGGGNPDLQPETGETFTVGMVVTPSNLEGLYASIDYYKTELTDAIESLSWDFIVSECVDLPSIDNVFCGQVDRDPITGFPSLIRTNGLNVGKLETSGVDFVLSYSGLDTKWGTWGANLSVNYVESLIFQSTPDPESAIDSLGITDIDAQALAPTPEWSGSLGVTWDMDKWNAAANVNYTEGVLRVFDGNANRSRASEIQEKPFLDDFYNVTLNGGYQLNDGVRFFAGMDNVFDEEPTIGEQFLPTGVYGRTVYFGFDMTLDSIPGLK